MITFIEISSNVSLSLNALKKKVLVVLVVTQLTNHSLKL